MNTTGFGPTEPVIAQYTHPAKDQTATNPDIIIDIPSEIENAVVPTARSKPSQEGMASGYLSLQYLMQRPRDAIAQFRKHVETFEINKTSIGCCEQHSAIERVTWISQQYQTFADLFHQAISSGLKASKTQHPGFYYYEAAVQIMKKRKLSSKLTCNVPQTSLIPLPNDIISPPTDANAPHDLGWSNQQYNPNIMDPLGISQYQQWYPIKYSDTIIQLLLKAIDHFKEWNCSRMEHFLIIMIADEYIESGEHQKAITIYSSALAMYKAERWIRLFKSISTKLEKIMNQQIGSLLDEGSRFDKMTRYEAHKCLDFRLPSIVNSLKKNSINQNVTSNSSILDMKVDVPAKVNCRQPFEVRLELNNLIDEEVGLQISIGRSESFMFCGSKMVHLNIGPKEFHTQYYILYPLICGNMTLPKLFLSVYLKSATSTEPINLDHMLEKLTNNIQIMPRAVFASNDFKRDDVVR